jgi:hypothetical protein
VGRIGEVGDRVDVGRTEGRVEDERVSTRAADQRVVAGLAIEDIVAAIAPQDVVARVAGNVETGGAVEDQGLDIDGQPVADRRVDGIGPGVHCLDHLAATEGPPFSEGPDPLVSHRECKSVAGRYHVL